MLKTVTTRFKEDGSIHKIEITYGMDYSFSKLNGQPPHFSVTAQACGARGYLHGVISKHFPFFRSLIKWHLVSTKEPRFYLDNGRYWWEMATGRQQSDCDLGESPLESFKSTVVWGAIPADTDLELLKMMKARGWIYVERMLRARLPALMAEFHRVMEGLGVLEGFRATRKTENKRKRNER